MELTGKWRGESHENRQRTEPTRNFIHPVVQHAASLALRKRKGMNQSQQPCRRNAAAI